MSPEIEDFMMRSKPSFDLVDHVARAEFFLSCALSAQNIDLLNWCIMAAISSCRSISEILIHQMKTGILTGNWEEFRDESIASIRHYKLIEYLRIHDFHRGVVRFDPRTMGMVGSITVNSGNQAHGAAAVSIDPSGGFRTSKQRNGHVNFDRPVQIRGFDVYDEDIGEFVPIDRMLRHYLEDMKIRARGYYPDVQWKPAPGQQAENRERA